MSPNILEVMSFRLGVFYPVTAATTVCCILMQILCVVSRKKLQLLGDIVPQTPYQGYAPGLRWGTSVLRSQSSFMSPNNPVRFTPLLINIAALRHFRHITTQKSVHLQGASPLDHLTRGTRGYAHGPCWGHSNVVRPPL